MVAQFSADEIADLQVIYQIGRTNVWPEAYPHLLVQTKAEQTNAERPLEQAAYLLNKRNLGEEVSEGVARLGRPRLAQTLSLL